MASRYSTIPITTFRSLQRTTNKQPVYTDTNALAVVRRDRSDYGCADHRGSGSLGWPSDQRDDVRLNGWWRFADCSGSRSRCWRFVAGCAGNVSQTAAITANGLALIVDGTTTLNLVSNNVATLAASNGLATIYRDADALSIGT